MTELENVMIDRGEDRRVSDRRMGWLVSDWRKATKWLSVQIPAAMTIIGLVYQGLEPFIPLLQGSLGPRVMMWVFIVGAVASIAGRLKAQSVKP